MRNDDMAKPLSLEARLGERLVGRTQAIATLAASIRNAQMSVRKAPLGLFLLVGPSGVGKTETARALAELLFDGERRMTTLDLAEYHDARAVSRLKDRDFGSGGVLLLEDVDKAHRDVLKHFFALFDRTCMGDGEARAIDIDIGETLIVMTTRRGSEVLLELWNRRPAHDELDPDEVLEQLRPVLAAHFQPAWLARLQVLPYQPLDEASLGLIARLKLDWLVSRLHEIWNIEFHATGEMQQLLADECSALDCGAHPIGRLVEDQLLPGIFRSLFARLSRQQALPAAVFISADAHDGVNIDYVDDASQVDRIRQALDVRSAARSAARQLVAETPAKAVAELLAVIRSDGKT